MKLTPIMKEFLKWQMDNGKIKHELTDSLVNENGETKFEKKTALILNYSYDDWKEFCKTTGREPEITQVLAYLDK